MSYREVLVFGMAPKENIRRAYEESFVAALSARGVRAKAASSLVPKGGLATLRSMQTAVELSGADAVIVTYLAGERPEPEPAPGRLRPRPPLYSRLYTYYGHVYDTVTEPGYYTNRTVLLLETNLYDTSRERLVWSGRSQSLDPASDQSLAEIVEAVIGELAKSGFVPRS